MSLVLTITLINHIIFSITCNGLHHFVNIFFTTYVNTIPHCKILEFTDLQTQMKLIFLRNLPTGRQYNQFISGCGRIISYIYIYFFTYTYIAIMYIFVHTFLYIQTHTHTVYIYTAYFILTIFITWICGKVDGWSLLLIYLFICSQTRVFFPPHFDAVGGVPVLAWPIRANPCRAKSPVLTSCDPAGRRLAPKRGRLFPEAVSRCRPLTELRPAAARGHLGQWRCSGEPQTVFGDMGDAQSAQRDIGREAAEEEEEERGAAEDARVDHSTEEKVSPHTLCFLDHPAALFLYVSANFHVSSHTCVPAAPLQWQITSFWYVWKTLMLDVVAVRTVRFTQLQDNIWVGRGDAVTATIPYNIHRGVSFRHGCLLG